MNARPLLLLFALGSGACGGPSTDPVIINDPILPGGLRVQWSFELQDGSAATCGEVDVARTLVSVGGLPGTPNAGQSFEEVECGEAQVVQFDGLPTGPRPVVVAAIGSNGETVAEFSTTVSIVAEQTTEVVHPFTLSGTGPATGDLTVRWTIDRQDPRSRCSEVEGATTRVATTAGSIEDFDLTVACTDGSVSFEDLRRGTYFVRLTLQDAAGRAISFANAEAQVRPSQATTAGADLLVEVREPSRIFAEWTIGGAPPEDRCDDFGAEEVEVRLQEFDPLRLRFVETAVTATAACAAPGIDLGGVASVGLRRLAYLLVDTSIGDRMTISSTISASFQVEAAMTSTITGDLPEPF